MVEKTFGEIACIWFETALTENSSGEFHNVFRIIFKGTVMQIEKALINDRLHVSKVS